MGARLLSAPDGHGSPRLRASGGAHRAAAARASRCLPTPRVPARSGRDRAPRRSPSCPELLSERARRRERHARRPGTTRAPARVRRRASRCCSSSRSRPTACGRGSRGPARRLRAGEQLGPVELARAARRRPLVAPARGRARRRDAAPAVHPRAARATPSATRPCTRAEAAGSAAAPTAGLHFTPELARAARSRAVTLHVGLDTFRPVTSDVLEEHAAARGAVRGDARGVGADRGGRRVLAVGTTTVRTLETVARTGELSGRTTLFVTPGFEFRRVDALLTNFHLPRSTLLALVMAFAGVEETRELYRVAVRGAIPLLLLRRRDARSLSTHSVTIRPSSHARTLRR